MCFGGIYILLCCPLFLYIDFFGVGFGLDADYYGFADVLILVMADITAHSLQSTAHTAHGLYQDIHVLWGVLVVVDLLYRCFIL